MKGVRKKLFLIFEDAFRTKALKNIYGNPKRNNESQKE